jgi:hypothetical protein
MTLEHTIAENTAALQELTAALLNQASVNTPTHVAISKRTTKKTGESGTAASVQVETAPVQASDPYADAAAAITELSRLKGREAALKVLAGFDATKLPGVAKDRLAEVAVAARQALVSCK